MMVMYRVLNIILIIILLSSIFHIYDGGTNSVILGLLFLLIPVLLSSSLS